jgi:hypothetical protein
MRSNTGSVHGAIHSGTSRATMSAGTVLEENTRTTRHPTISVLVLAAQSPYKTERTSLPPLLLLALNILKLWPRTCLRSKGF